MPSPRYTREIPARLRLETTRCRACGKVTYPAYRACPSCRGRDMEPVTLSRNGKVVTCTVLHVAPEEFAFEAPFAMAIVETPEGARLMVQVADCEPDEVRPGMEVALEFRKIRREGKAGILCYGFKAVPAGGAR
jgi:uncharacterized OB-fold protein